MTHTIDPENRPYDPDTVPAKPVAGIEPLAALDVRVGRVLTAEPAVGTREPALWLSVDFGPHVGVLVTSAKIVNYEPDDVIGRDVVGVVNLGEKRIGGFTSQFLVLGGLEPDGTVRLLAPDAPLAPGSVVA